MSLTVDETKAAPAGIDGRAASDPTARATTIGPSVFSSDSAGVPDSLARGGEAAFLAELICHREAGTPMSIGLFGPAGSGKSTFLALLLRSVTRLARAADEAGIATPFHANVATALVDIRPGAAPGATLVQQCLTGLSATHPRLAANVSHAGLDPRAAARQAGDGLNEARQRLDAERRTLDELTGRQARLGDSVLFDHAGSSIDTYARANRGRIERSFQRFGFDGDPLMNYKQQVRDAGVTRSQLGHAPSLLRAVWAYRGQARLIVLAIVFFAIAWGLGFIFERHDRLIDALRSSNETMAGAADWAQAHIEWLASLKELAIVAGVVAIVTNVVRAVRFLQPIARGATLLRSDVDSRRRELDSLVAHQTRRVDTLVAETDLASQRVAEAETRLATQPAGVAAPVITTLSTGSAPNDVETARNVFAAIGAAMKAGANDRVASSAAAAPARFVVGLDGFDAVSGSEAAAFLQTAHALLDQPGFVVIAAADRIHLATGLAETDPALATARLSKMVQLPYTIGREDESWHGALPFVRSLLGPDVPGMADSAQPDATHSALDRPWLPSEAPVLDSVALWVGSTPRAIKRFVNLYRVARADPRLRDGSAQDLAALALGLALGTTGSDPGFATNDLDDRARSAHDAVRKALGVPLDSASSERGRSVASRYTA